MTLLLCVLVAMTVNIKMVVVLADVLGTAGADGNETGFPVAQPTRL